MNSIFDKETVIIFTKLLIYFLKILAYNFDIFKNSPDQYLKNYCNSHNVSNRKHETRTSLLNNPLGYDLKKMSVYNFDMCLLSLNWGLLPTIEILNQLKYQRD